MIKDIDAVIFDLDGTLVDSMWMWKTIDIEYLDRFGIEFPEDLQDHRRNEFFRDSSLF